MNRQISIVQQEMESDQEVKNYNNVKTQLIIIYII